MSWITVIWAAAAGACVTLAAVHLAAWTRDRSLRANPWFAVAALSVAGLAITELLLMRAESPDRYLSLHRWGHVQFFCFVVAIIGFIQSYFGTGRRWLAWTFVVWRALILAVTFAIGPTFNFREVTALLPAPFLGETIVVAQAVPNPWAPFGELSGVLFLAFVVDAAIRLWRKGGSDERRRAVVVGGGVVLCFAAMITNGILVHLEGKHAPYFIAWSFMLIIAAMAFELSWDVVRTARLVADLRDRTENIRLAAQAAQIALWRWDVVRDTIWVSPEGRRLYGVPDGEPIDFQRFVETLHPGDRDPTRSAVEAALDGNGEFRSSYRVIHPDGTTRWIEARGQVHRDLKEPQLRGVSIDVTERKQAEEDARELRRDLAHAGRVTLLGQLSSALAHELSQPLGAILRNAEAAELILETPSPDLAELRAIVQDIHSDEQRAGAVINRLRSLLKRGNLDFQPVRLPEIAGEAVALLRADAASRHVELKTAVPENLPVVRGDRVQLIQVILNLIVNAMDAIESAGSRRREVLLSATFEAPDRMEIRVRDTGPGMAPEVLARLFDSFYTTKSGGMGMGLPISKTIIEAHGGSLEAADLAGEGAEFRIILPSGPVPPP